ncbi:hypothetical protein D3871_07380 [Noviherbaspirillum saxi]|uniref:Uncharacterized protein n=1 Tax=Noviherbaspirillum saxi TaxID=2320863 RepID=A0A3A3G878_9BURK|nr:hypothetical protein D3871_07380 [Noviherbaspirillum saxi]
MLCGRENGLEVKRIEKENETAEEDRQRKISPRIEDDKKKYPKPEQAAEPSIDTRLASVHRLMAP